jgi:lipopolysaccharide export system permease protein
MGQNEARSYIRNSNIDFFPSLIKEGKFIDTVSNLTIFIESKDLNGNYKNIFLNDSLNGNKKHKATKSQMIYAKNGRLFNDENNRYFELKNGKMITNDNGKITNFAFDKINFNLQKYDSKTTTYPKIQETTSRDLLRCILYDFKKEIKKFIGEYLICEESTIKNVKEESLKRFYKPIYFPLLALLSCLLVLRSKENRNYNKFKLFLFSIIFFILVISEMSLRYSTESIAGILFFTLFPILSFLIVYLSVILKFNKSS